jgi:hypothetical protein
MIDRKFKRISFISQAMVMTGSQRFEALTKDLSLDGLFIATDRLIPVGQMVSISLKMPSVSRSSELSVDGVVVRSSVRGVAFRFKSLGHDTFVYLKTVINHRKQLVCQ